mmetsp:Transcript_2840/g.259  ORF Transcript_2840/g.259 Transcript_2840/m.259 type:complete len:89 (-) Transcript_2840:194-460(-)
MALILLSAVDEKNLALTTTGIVGNLPFPKTLKNPDLVTSITGTRPSLLSAYLVLVSSETKLHNLSMLTTGQCLGFFFSWKTLIPFLPK